MVRDCDHPIPVHYITRSGIFCGIISDNVTKIFSLINNINISYRPHSGQIQNGLGYADVIIRSYQPPEGCPVGGIDLPLGKCQISPPPRDLLHREFQTAF